MHVELEHLLSHNSLAKCFTKKKNEQHFHDHAAYDYSREYNSHWSVTTIRMAYVAHPYTPPIIEYMHNKACDYRKESKRHFNVAKISVS